MITVGGRGLFRNGCPAPEPNVIIVRSVYWDNRSRKNTNSVHVFLVEITQSALEMKSVVGCQVGNSLTTDFEVASCGAGSS